MNQKRAQVSRSARQALLLGLAAFIALQIVLAITIQCWLPQIRDPQYAFPAAQLRSRSSSQADAKLVVMLGSSRTQYGLCGSMLEGKLGRELGQPVIVYNFGISGAGPATSLLALRRLLAEGVHPDLLLVEVLPALLADPHHGPPLESAWLKPTRLELDEISLLDRYQFSGAELRRFWWQALACPCYGHRFGLVSQINAGMLPLPLRHQKGQLGDHSGWVAQQFMPLSARPKAVREAWDTYHAWMIDFHFGTAAGMLCELLELCRQHDISTALVLMPEGSTFQSWYPPGSWRQIEAFLNDASRRYQAPLINARDWVADEHFSDSHHLLVEGAVIFTERLGCEGILPALKRPQKPDSLAPPPVILKTSR